MLGPLAHQGAVGFQQQQLRVSPVKAAPAFVLPTRFTPLLDAPLTYPGHGSQPPSSHVKLSQMAENGN
jgi:hypothetical protein